MAHTTSKTFASTPSHAAAPPFDTSFASDPAAALLRMQRMQWDLMTAWQRSLVASQQEMWDQWTSHWAGGVPLDG